MPRAGICCCRFALRILVVLGFNLYLMGQTQVASLRPNPELHWQRVSPSAEKPDGPVLYQLLFSTAGTPGTLAKFDTNPRNLTNSDITDNGGIVAVGGMSINAGTGIITFAGGQTFPGAGGSVSITASTGLVVSPSPITGTGTIGIATGGVGNAQLAAGAVLAGNIAGGQVVKNLNGLFDGVTLAAGTGVSITPSGQTLTIANTSPASLAWGLTGNSGTGCTTSSCAKFLGTTDNTNLEMRVNNQRGYRIESATNTLFGTFSPNILGRVSGVVAGVGGGTMAGGGPGGGRSSVVTDDLGKIGGGIFNQAGDGAGTTFDKPYATVGGGNNNTAGGSFSTVGGGTLNTAGGSSSFVGGGTVNNAHGSRATGAGGAGNAANNNFDVVGGGYGNQTSGVKTTIAGGGRTNDADATTGNRVTDDFGTVGGGGNNQAGDNMGTTSDRPYATVAGGFGNIASGDTSTIAGGSQNAASGQISFVGGGFATKATAPAATVGGAIFYPFYDISTGVRLFSGGGGWASLSDRNVKEHFTPVDRWQLLARVLALPITTWKYKSQAASIRHIGPMAQDFHAAFDVGEDDKHITEIDEGGVALAAIQGLNQKMEEELQKKNEQIARAHEQLAAQQRQIEALQLQMRAMMR